MTDKNKNKNKKNIIISEEQHDYIELDDNKINYFPNGFINEFITGNSIVKYKLAIYWIPIVLFTIIMLILVHVIFEAAIYDEDIWISELLGSILAGVVIFICYFLVDFIYQLQLCKEQEIEQDVMNSLFNALHISIIVAIGYMLGIFLHDSIISDVRVANESFSDTMEKNVQAAMGKNPTDARNSISSTGLGNQIHTLDRDTLEEMNEQKQAEQTNLLYLMLSSSHYNNIGMAILFYFIGMAYWNPYYDNKSSQNRICTKKKVKK